MKNTSYDRARAMRLLPLLHSITGEIQERADALEAVEERIERASDPAHRGDTEIHDLVAEAATHRHELRRAKEELLGLGCSIVGTEPITIRIPGRRGSIARSFVWRSGDLLLR